MTLKLSESQIEKLSISPSISLPTLPPSSKPEQESDKVLQRERKAIRESPRFAKYTALHDKGFDEGPLRVEMKKEAFTEKEIDTFFGHTLESAPLEVKQYVHRNVVWVSPARNVVGSPVPTSAGVSTPGSERSRIMLTGGVATSDEIIVCSGKLYKRGKYLLDWHRRYFVLRQSRLEYYKRKSELQAKISPRDAINLHSFIRLELEGVEKCVLLIYTSSGRTVALKAETRRDALSWMDALYRTVMKFRSDRKLTNDVSLISKDDQNTLRLQLQSSVFARNAAMPVNMIIGGSLHGISSPPSLLLAAKDGKQVVQRTRHRRRFTYTGDHAYNSKDTTMAPTSGRNNFLTSTPVEEKSSNASLPPASIPIPGTQSNTTNVRSRHRRATYSGYGLSVGSGVGIVPMGLGKQHIQGVSDKNNKNSGKDRAKQRARAKDDNDAKGAEEMELEESAITIQRMFRNKSVSAKEKQEAQKNEGRRKYPVKAMNRERAATLLQSQFRGGLARKQLKAAQVQSDDYHIDYAQEKEIDPHFRNLGWSMAPMIFEDPGKKKKNNKEVKKPKLPTAKPGTSGVGLDLLEYIEFNGGLKFVNDMVASDGTNTSGKSQVSPVQQKGISLSRSGHRKGSLIQTHMKKQKFSSIRIFLLVRWINYLDIWTKIEESGTEREVASRLEHECRNGLLLTRLVETLLPKRTKHAFVTLNPRPLRRSICIANIELFLAVIWKCGLNARRIPSAKEIFEMKKNRTKGLLSEMFDVIVAGPLYTPRGLERLIDWLQEITSTMGLPLDTEVLDIPSSFPRRITKGKLIQRKKLVTKTLWSNIASGERLFMIALYFNSNVKKLTKYLYRSGGQKPLELWQCQSNLLLSLEILKDMGCYSIFPTVPEILFNNDEVCPDHEMFVFQLDLIRKRLRSGTTWMDQIDGDADDVKTAIVNLAWRQHDAPPIALLPGVKSQTQYTYFDVVQKALRGRDLPELNTSSRAGVPEPHPLSPTSPPAYRKGHGPHGVIVPRGYNSTPTSSGPSTFEARQGKGVGHHLLHHVTHTAEGKQTYNYFLKHGKPVNEQKRPGQTSKKSPGHASKVTSKKTKSPNVSVQKDDDNNRTKRQVSSVPKQRKRHAKSIQVERLLHDGEEKLRAMLESSSMSLDEISPRPTRPAPPPKPDAQEGVKSSVGDSAVVEDSKDETHRRHRSATLIQKRFRAHRAQKTRKRYYSYVTYGSPDREEDKDLMKLSLQNRDMYEIEMLDAKVQPHQKPKDQQIHSQLKLKKKKEEEQRKRWNSQVLEELMSARFHDPQYLADQEAQREVEQKHQHAEEALETFMHHSWSDDADRLQICHEQLTSGWRYDDSCRLPEAVRRKEVELMALEEERTLRWYAQDQPMSSLEEADRAFAEAKAFVAKESKVHKAKVMLGRSHVMTRSQNGLFTDAPAQHPQSKSTYRVQNIKSPWKNSETTYHQPAFVRRRRNNINRVLHVLPDKIVKPNFDNDTKSTDMSSAEQFRSAQRQKALEWGGEPRQFQLHQRNSSCIVVLTLREIDQEVFLSWTALGEYDEYFCRLADIVHVGLEGNAIVLHIRSATATHNTGGLSVLCLQSKSKFVTEALHEHIVALKN
eukprot:g1076.t1